MLSIYKSKNTTRVCAIKSKNQFLHGLAVYIVRKIRDKIEQDDIDGVLATHLFFNAGKQGETDYDDSLKRAKKEKVTFEDVHSLNEITLDDKSSFALLPYDEKSIDRDSIFLSGSAGVVRLS